MERAKWIKLDTDIFDNRKLRYIRRLPQGDRLALLWVMLLTLAGKCNARGRIFLTEEIPYSAETLAGELGVSSGLMERALDAFEALDMLERDAEGYILLTGWEEHQNVEGMEKAKEQNRIRQKNWYDRQKSLSEVETDNGEPNAQPNVRPNVNLTQPNATEEDKEIERDIEIDKKKKSKKEKGADAQDSTSLLTLISDYSFSNALKQRVEDWVQYKAERKEAYREQGFRALLRQIESNASKYGEQAVCELIEQSMASGWKGIIFDRLKEPTGEKPSKGLYVSKGVYINPDDYINGPALGWGD